MAKDNFAACVAWTLAREGGFQDDPNDEGNYRPDGTLVGTNFGISAAAYPTLDIRALTQADAEAIYQRDYWTRVQGEYLPLGVDLVVFDEAVNAGVSRSAKLLQAALGVVADGDIGPVTLYRATNMDPAELVQSFTSFRAGFYAHMANAARYSVPLIERARDCEKAALAMLSG
jgi:lysozyme family protein